jgi:hypothetical protein
MGSEVVWVIEILSPRDDFKSYLAGYEGSDDYLWVEDPDEAVHYANQTAAETVANTIDMHGHAHVVSHLTAKKRERLDLPILPAA